MLKILSYKIQVSMPDVVEALRKHFWLDDDSPIEIVIEGANDFSVTDRRKVLADLLLSYQYCGEDKKIHRIKTFRVVADSLRMPLDLASAKHMIEDPMRARDYVLGNGCMNQFTPK